MTEYRFSIKKNGHEQVKGIQISNRYSINRIIIFNQSRNVLLVPRVKIFSRNALQFLNRIVLNLDEKVKK